MFGFMGNLLGIVAGVRFGHVIGPTAGAPLSK